MTMKKIEKQEEDVVFVDSRGKKWTFVCLRELVESLYLEADAEQLKRHHIKGKYYF